MKNIIDLLYKFTEKKMTMAQFRQAAEIEDDFLLTTFIVSAYNCYVITHSGERHSLITNIDALKINENEFQIFLQDFRTYIMDTIKTKDFENERKKDLLKDKENGQND
jgi:hypothetical protein